MAFTDAHRSPQELAQREADLQAMRERFRKTPPRSRSPQLTAPHQTRHRRQAKPLSWKPAQLAHAIRIAAKDAQARPNHNPLFVEALEIAASYFGDL
jgi:hypothetical protein